MNRFICGQTRCPEDRYSCKFDEDSCPLYIRTVETIKVPRNKYQAEKCEYNGEEFDSRRELRRYLELKLLERSGRISDLKRQVKFELIPSQKDEQGKVLFRPCTYIADFTYQENRKLVVEDCKGIRTEIYKLKKKLFYQKYKIMIKET